MTKEFKNKNEWGLILGGSSGLGLASAKKLASHGMNICIVHRNLRGEMTEVQDHFKMIENNGVSFMSFNKDVCRKEHLEEVVKAMKEKFGNEAKIKVLVHSIARGNLKPMRSEGASDQVLSGTDLSLTIQAMAISMYDWTQRMYFEGLFSKEASIIGFTSEGNVKVIEGYGAVSAAKVTLESISRQMAVEFAGKGLRVNCIQAGVTDTRSLRMIPKSDQIIEIARKRNPNGRITRPEDVAGVVYLMCKEESRWINGTTLIVDGGEHLR